MIYIHVPFCRSFCTYCGFYSEAVPVCRERNLGLDVESRRFSKYAGLVCSEIEARADEIRATLPTEAHPEYRDTLYIGGGTPSVLPFDVLERIVSCLNKTVFGSESHDYLEFTLEVNPEDIVEKGEVYLQSLERLGVTRISMGIQSFDDAVLKWMNRRHDSAHAEQAYWMLRGHGFRNISIDLIFGIGGLSRQTWEATVHKAMGLSPSHISAYQLSVEEGSALAREVEAGRYTEASEEECRAQYEMLCSILEENGYHHYEVSNFAYPGFESRHNSSYWRRVPYVGLGPGAHSAVADERGRVNVRKWNTETEDDYVSEREVLDDEDVRVEEIMLGLRTDEGVSPSLLPQAIMSRFLEEGVLCRTVYGNVRIPEDRFFVSDEIIRELL